MGFKVFFLICSYFFIAVTAQTGQKSALEALNCEFGKTNGLCGYEIHEGAYDATDEDVQFSFDKTGELRLESETFIAQSPSCITLAHSYDGENLEDPNRIMFFMNDIVGHYAIARVELFKELTCSQFTVKPPKRNSTGTLEIRSSKKNSPFGKLNLRNIRTKEGACPVVSKPCVRKRTTGLDHVLQSLTCHFLDGEKCDYSLCNSDHWTFDYSPMNSAKELSLKAESGFVTSPRLLITSDICLTIDYYTSGSGSLQILVTNVSSRRSTGIFASEVPDQWSSAKVTVPRTKGFAMLTIAAQRGLKDWKDDVIVGNVQAASGACP